MTPTSVPDLPDEIKLLPEFRSMMAVTNETALMRAIKAAFDYMNTRPQSEASALATPVGWIKTTDRLPEKPCLKSYEYVDCLIYHRGEIKQRPWNCEHLCWDDEHYDDFYCAPTDPTHWQPLPAPPHTEERG